MQLKGLLNALENLHPESEVRIVIQPSYPLEYKVKGVVTQSEIETGYTASNKDDVVYLVVGSQIGYGTKRVFDYL